MSTIAVVETKWWGHHPMFAKRITRALLEKGHEVLVVCSKPDEVVEYLEQVEQKNRKTHAWFGALDFQDIEKPPPLLCRNRSDYWRMRTWRRTAVALRKLTERSGFVPDVVFFCMADDFVNAPGSAAESRALFPHPWTGLVIFPQWLHGSPGHIPDCVTDSHCKGLFLLDETLVGMARELTDKPFYAFPELTDICEPPPGYRSELLDQIEAFRAGRKLVGLFGVVDRRKGIFHLLQIARSLREHPIAFVIAGDATDAGSMSDVDTFEQELGASGLTNVFFRRGRIAQDEEFNALVRLVDLLWVAYPNFVFSSNQLTKAAYLGTPVAVNIGGLLSERVRKYNLGLDIPVVNERRAAEAICKFLLEDSTGPIKQPSLEYFSLHSPEQFERVMDLIPKIGRT